MTKPRPLPKVLTPRVLRILFLAFYPLNVSKRKSKVADVDIKMNQSLTQPPSSSGNSFPIRLSWVIQVKVSVFLFCFKLAMTNL